MDKGLEIRKRILEMAAEIDPRWKDAEVEYNENNENKEEEKQ